LHGKAKEISLSIFEEKTNYVFSVQDNGEFQMKAISKKQDNHFGLDLIKEKLKLLSGEMRIEVDEGTKMTLTIPRKEERHDYKFSAD
jgi:nitrate/nitrite-specific signal transduction histidine kinase